MSVLSFDISGSQIDGARDYQEDAFLITHLGDSDSETSGSMVIVADGMGGHAAGNVASNMAVQTFNRHLAKNFPNPNISNVLHEAVLQANGSITATVAETAALKGMGCTLVACVLDCGGLRWVSVGDSHLYLLRYGELTKKNADHSYGGFLDRMADAGTPVEAEAGFSRNMLMSALTGEDIAEIDCPETPLQLRPGDRVILSSDGLDTLTQEKIIEICAASPSAKQCVDALLQGVTEGGAPRQDNTTVIVIDVVAKPEAAAEPAPPPKPAAQAEDLDNIRPVAVAATSAFPVEDGPRKSPLGLTAAVVVALAILVGGGYWYITQGGKMPAPASPAVTVDSSSAADSDVVEIDAVEEEPVAQGEVTPQAEPAAAATPAPLPAAASNTGQFRDRLHNGGEGPLMVWIPPGRFTMGNPISTSDPDERPQHQVSVPQYAIGANEITVAEFRKFANATGLKMPPLGPIADEANFPMTFVSWNDALAYTQWLSQQTGKEYSLPTEAQWEHAARAGSDSAYPWGRNLGRSNAHCFACDTGLDPRQPTAVGRFSPNKFGLYDTSGNVQEWVYDCYHPSYDMAPADGSVFEGGNCTVRVLRGGGYGSGPDELGSASRDKFRVDKGNDQTGFRVMRKS